MSVVTPEKSATTATRVSCTQPSQDLIKKLEGLHGPLLFHQSGGCCDGSSPMCYPRKEFKVGAQDVYMGEIGGQPFYMGRSQFEYWQHTQLEVDVTPGRGASFSLEIPLGLRFVIRSRLFSEEEEERLAAVRRGSA